MSTFKEIIDRVDEIKPNAFSEKMKLNWLTSLNGKLAIDIFMMDIAQVQELPHGDKAADSEPLVGFPHEEVYDEYLAAKIDAANGEASEYQNRMQIYDAYYSNFVVWFKSTYDPIQGNPDCHGLKPKLPTYYITAYGMARKCGYTGTLEQWLESLKGEKGDRGTTAYEYAVAGGYKGTEEEYMTYISVLGKNAYQYAQDGGYQGTEEEFSLKLAQENYSKPQIDELLKRYLLRSGGVMTGKIDMGANKITNIAVPEDNTDVVNKAYADEIEKKAANAQNAAVEAEKNAKKYADSLREPFTVVVPAAGWSEATPYTQTIAVEGILETDMPHYGVVYSADIDTALAEKEAFSLVDDLDTAEGSVTFTCFEEKPETDLTIQMEVNR